MTELHEPADEEDLPLPAPIEQFLEDIRNSYRNGRDGKQWAPTDRDLAVYRATTCENRSQRDVAREFQLSQTRVCQLIKQVECWISKRTPRALLGFSKAERLNLAVHLERDRLNYLYGQAVTAWQASTKPVVTVKKVETRDGIREERVIRNSPGQVRFLAEAARLNRQLAELDGADQRSDLRDRDEDEEQVIDFLTTVEGRERFCEWFEERLAEAYQSLEELKRQQQAEQDEVNSPEVACSTWNLNSETPRMSPTEVDAATSVEQRGSALEAAPNSVCDFSTAPVERAVRSDESPVTDSAANPRCFTDRIPGS